MVNSGPPCGTIQSMIFVGSVHGVEGEFTVSRDKKGVCSSSDSFLSRPVVHVPVPTEGRRVGPEQRCAKADSDTYCVYRAAKKRARST